MTNTSAISALDFVDAPESDQSRCSAPGWACVRGGCRLIAARAIHKLLHSSKCKFLLTM
jgi:hypothetical protein